MRVVVHTGGCFEESRLRICFDKTWRVLIFDKTEWFRHLTGMGFKGVDFIGLRDEKVFLIEVKNFQPSHSGKGITLPEPVNLEKSLAEKFIDSQRVAGVILGTMERYLLFRWWRWVVGWWPWLRRMEPEWAFWLDVSRRIQSGQLRRVVLLHHAPSTMTRDWPYDWIVIHDEDDRLLPGGLNIETTLG